VSCGDEICIIGADRSLSISGINTLVKHALKLILIYGDFNKRLVSLHHRYWSQLFWYNNQNLVNCNQTLKWHLSTILQSYWNIIQCY